MPSLTWIGKDAVLNHHLDVPYRVLEKKYDFGDGEPGNKIIHGDNLEALKSLLPEYEGRVKCIYIDPPYNTGNENWVYNDNVNSPKIRHMLSRIAMLFFILCASFLVRNAAGHSAINTS